LHTAVCAIWGDEGLRVTQHEKLQLAVSMEVILESLTINR
jgi:hypothetical protein